MLRFLAVLTLFATGCEALPRDARGTTDHVRGGELRVGVVEDPPWVVGGPLPSAAAPTSA